MNKKLSHSDLNFLTGHIEQQPDNKFQGLYWLDNQVDLQQFKEAIGAKLVWKYRLYFFNELEQSKEPVDNQNNLTGFTDKEAALIKRMREKTSSKSKKPKKKAVTKIM